MARFGLNNADNYGGQGGGGYFSLKNDKDIAKVRFLFDSAEDVEGFAVHEVTIDGKKRYVNCLREYGEPIDACPLCAKGSFVQAKYFIPLFNLETNRVETWERGKKFGSKLSSLCARYPHLVSHTFEIERNGKAGDTQTTYEIYETGQDDATMDDFEVPKILGSHVMDKSFDELQYYADMGSFPDDENGAVRRRPTQTAERRTPVRNNSEAF